MHVKRQKNKVQSSNSKKKWLPVIALIIMVFLYYGNTLKNGYSLDDDLVTTTDNSVHERVEKGILGLPDIFTTHYVYTDQQQYEYRPIVTASFAIEYQFVGDKSIKKRASISHLINVMLYALLIVLIYLLIFKLFPDKGWVFPFFVALLFLIHPIHSEVVNNIKCRDELFVMIFGLFAMFSFLKYVDSEYKKLIYLIVGVLMIALSILSKKVGFTFIVLVPLVLYYFRDVKIRKFVVVFGLMLIGVFVFYLLKKTALTDGVVREKMFFENPLYFADSKLERVPMFFYSIMYYLKMMVLPAPLVYYYGYDQIQIVGWSNPFVWVGVLFVFSGVLFAIKRIRKKEMWAFGFLFFMFGVGGGANLLFPAVGIVAERFVFTGSLGLIFLTVYYGFQLYEKNKKQKSKFAFYSLGGLLLILSFSQVTSRNKDWNSRFSLYKNDIKNLPNSAKAHSLLGTEYTAKADSVSRIPGSSHLLSMSYIDSAILEFESGLEIYDGYFNCANNAGALIFSRKKDYARAKPFFSKALEYKPTYVQALFNYGNCLQYDLNAINELQLILKNMKHDSIGSPDLSKQSQIYGEELKSAFAIYSMKLEISKVFGNIKIDKPNWKEIAVFQVMQIIKMYLQIEDGLVKNAFDTRGYKAKMLSYFNVMNRENGLSQLQQLMSYTERYLSGPLKESMTNQSKLDSGYLDLIKINLVKQEKKVYDSIQKYWYKALDEDKTYYYCYKSLSELYFNEKDFDQFIEINKKAISQGEFDSNTEFYLNIGNGYNTQTNFSEAIIYMQKAVIEIDTAYMKYYNSNDGNNHSKLIGLLNQKKQILRFIAKIYDTSGDQENAAKYQKLSNEI